MENQKILNAVNELKETMKSVVVELKETIKENLSTLSCVKQNLATAYNGLEEIGVMAEDLSVGMELLAEDTNDSVEMLGEVLAVIDPDNFGDDEEDFEEEEDYIVVEDTETGEETEYPIN
jgi:methyl-accepting chemotaxis protein